MKRVWSAASWVAPPLFCLYVYWFGLKVWFLQDDFAWLKLRSEIYNWHEFWRVMFAPMAQGTIRPWSERAFFIGFYSLFGLNALPFRICIFLTQFANLTLLNAIARRLTGSPAAGFWAAIFWTANNILLEAMTWSSVYNQVLCAFFLLLAFYFFLRKIEALDSNRHAGRYEAAQWTAFLLGFGALEINVVYPAIPAVYALLFARSHFRGTLPLFVPSILFTIVHRAVAPKVSAPGYAMHFGVSIWRTFWNYLVHGFGLMQLHNALTIPRWIASAATGILMIGLFWFSMNTLRRGGKLPLFFLAWFVIAILPVLPLKEHFSEYYLTVPCLGLAMLGGWGFASAWQPRVRLSIRVAAAALGIIYLGLSLAAIRPQVRDRYQLSRRVERVVSGVVRARELHPDKGILLTGVDSTLFWKAINDDPFRAAGVTNVYLAPGSEDKIDLHPELGSISEFVLASGPALEGLAKGRIVVYSVAGERLKNVTTQYELSSRSLKPEAPRRVDVGSDELAYLLGRGWYPRDGAFRWMSKSATLRIGGPRTASERLHVMGVCPAEQTKTGPLPLRISVNGTALPEVLIKPGQSQLEFDFALAPDLVGHETIEVTIEPARTIMPPDDGRVLGLAFGIFEVK